MWNQFFKTLTLAPSKGEDSVHISYKIQPRAHTSLANEKKFETKISGAIYNGVPQTSFL